MSVVVVLKIWLRAVAKACTSVVLGFISRATLQRGMITGSGRKSQPQKAAERESTSPNTQRDAITPLVVRAVTTDGCHHKQWYLEAIAEALQIELPPHDLGIVP